MEIPTLKLELLGTVNVYLGLGIEIITALILGGVIGIDREQKMKSAGIKTNILICLGATLYTAISLLNLDGTTGPVDPNRTGAQIVSGIGFLGAGAIIQGRGSVIGLTTAASIWVVAAIGMTIGSGYPVIATLFTLTLLIVLKIIGPFYKFAERKKDHLLFKVEVLTRGNAKKSLMDICLKFTDDIDSYKEEVIDEEHDERICSFKIVAHPRRMANLRRELKSLLKVEKVNYRSARKKSSRA